MERSVEMNRRVFRLHEVDSLNDLNPGDLFVMYEPDNGEPVIGGRASRVLANMPALGDNSMVNCEDVVMKREVPDEVVN